MSQNWACELPVRWSLLIRQWHHSQQKLSSECKRSIRQVRIGHHRKWINFIVDLKVEMTFVSKFRIINFTSASYSADRTGDLSILPNCDSINASNFILYLPSNFSWLTRKGWQSSNVQHSFPSLIISTLMRKIFEEASSLVQSQHRPTTPVSCWLSLIAIRANSLELVKPHIDY